MILSIRIVNEYTVTSILLSDCSRGRPIRIWELGEKDHGVCFWIFTLYSLELDYWYSIWIFGEPDMSRQ